MFDKFKIVAVLTAATLSLVGCASEADKVEQRSEADKTEQRLEDYTPDTSLPITQQIADSGVATDPAGYDDVIWNRMAMAYCGLVLNIDQYPEYETTDDILLDEGFDEVWDKAERDTIARIMTTNHCPNRSAK